MAKYKFGDMIEVDAAVVMCVNGMSGVQREVFCGTTNITEESDQSFWLCIKGNRVFNYGVIYTGPLESKPFSNLLEVFE